MARLPLVPPGTSDDLADLLRSWAEVYRLTWAAEDDDDQGRLGEDARRLIRKIAAYRSTSCADIATKLGLGMFELNGAATFDHPGITDDGDLLIRCGLGVDRGAELLLMAAGMDAARLRGI